MDVFQNAKADPNAPKEAFNVNDEEEKKENPPKPKR